MSRVMIVVRVVAGVLLAHGLVHLLYPAPDVPEFSIGRSWLLPEPARRPVALMLMAATVAGFALVALAVWGVPGLSAAWPAFTIVACVLSMALLAVFWDTVLVIGIVIDVALVVIAVTRQSGRTGSLAKEEDGFHERGVGRPAYRVHAGLPGHAHGRPALARGGGDP
jgi:hypothetical protein